MEGGDGEEGCKLDADAAVARQALEDAGADVGSGGGDDDQLRQWVEGWMSGELLFTRLCLEEGMSVLLGVVGGKGPDELLR